MKINLLKSRKILKRSSGFLHKIGRDPYIDWQLIMAAAMLTAFVLVAIGFVQFEGVVLKKSDYSVPERITPPKPILDVNQLHAVLSTFESHAIETKELESGYRGSGDPAL
jgi:hypothetical protein